MDKQKRDLFVAIINRFRTKHPIDWGKWEAVRDLRKKELIDEFGAFKEQRAFRSAGNIPEQLHKQFIVLDPDYIGSRDRAKDFLKEFPIFKIADKL